MFLILLFVFFDAVSRTLPTYVDYNADTTYQNSLEGQIDVSFTLYDESDALIGFTTNGYSPGVRFFFYPASVTVHSNSKKSLSWIGNACTAANKTWFGTPERDGLDTFFGGAFTCNTRATDDVYTKPECRNKSRHQCKPPVNGFLLNEEENARENLGFKDLVFNYTGIDINKGQIYHYSYQRLQIPYQDKIPFHEKNNFRYTFIDNDKIHRTLADNEQEIGSAKCKFNQTTTQIACTSNATANAHLEKAIRYQDFEQPMQDTVLFDDGIVNHVAKYHERQNLFDFKIALRKLLPQACPLFVDVSFVRLDKHKKSTFVLKGGIVKMENARNSTQRFKIKTSFVESISDACFYNGTSLTEDKLEGYDLSCVPFADAAKVHFLTNSIDPICKQIELESISVASNIYNLKTGHNQLKQWSAQFGRDQKYNFWTNHIFLSGQSNQVVSIPATKSPQNSGIDASGFTQSTALHHLANNLFYNLKVQLLLSTKATVFKLSDIKFDMTVYPVTFELDTVSKKRVVTWVGYGCTRNISEQGTTLESLVKDRLLAAFSCHFKDATKLSNLAHQSYFGLYQGPNCALTLGQNCHRPPNAYIIRFDSLNDDWALELASLNIYHRGLHLTQNKQQQTSISFSILQEVTEQRELTSHFNGKLLFMTEEAITSPKDEIVPACTEDKLKCEIDLFKNVDLLKDSFPEDIQFSIGTLPTTKTAITHQVYSTQNSFYNLAVTFDKSDSCAVYGRVFFEKYNTTKNIMMKMGGQILAFKTAKSKAQNTEHSLKVTDVSYASDECRYEGSKMENGIIANYNKDCIPEVDGLAIYFMTNQYEFSCKLPTILKISVKSIIHNPSTGDPIQKEWSFHKKIDELLFNRGYRIVFDKTNSHSFNEISGIDTDIYTDYTRNTILQKTMQYSLSVKFVQVDLTGSEDIYTRLNFYPLQLGEHPHGENEVIRWVGKPCTDKDSTKFKPKPTQKGNHFGGTIKCVINLPAFHYDSNARKINGLFHDDVCLHVLTPHCWFKKFDFAFNLEHYHVDDREYTLAFKSLNATFHHYDLLTGQMKQHKMGHSETVINPDEAHQILNSKSHILRRAGNSSYEVSSDSTGISCFYSNLLKQSICPFKKVVNDNILPALHFPQLKAQLNLLKVSGFNKLSENSYEKQYSFYEVTFHFTKVPPTNCNVTMEIFLSRYNDQKTPEVKLFGGFVDLNPSFFGGGKNTIFMKTKYVHQTSDRCSADNYESTSCHQFANTLVITLLDPYQQRCQESELKFIQIKSIFFDPIESDIIQNSLQFWYPQSIPLAFSKSYLFHKNEKGESLWNVMPREWAPKNESHTEVLPEKADTILENSEGSHFFVPCIVLEIVWFVLIGIVVSELFTFIVLMIVRKKLVQRRKLDELSESEEATDQEEVLKLATANKTGPSNTGNENVVEDDKEEVNEDGTPKVSDQANNSEAAVTDQDGNSPDKDRKPNQKGKPGFKKKLRAANKPKPLIKGSTTRKGPVNKSKPTPRKKAPPIPKCAPKKAPAPRRRKK